ncbi:hypothetical protein NQ176_g3775 [Zarea fungicola]|uniref:Uncharacterized protein n=1 Tax=Zarea fungicola TaxID=93591 RepID=A0ACC1NJB6_9HYPO|nr:hypothetical protein NQ176_g3775 [Lecanicillium fungicola]
MALITDMPTELLDQILHYLGNNLRDISALLRTCRKLHLNLNQWLYRHRRKISRALTYAIKRGNEEGFNLVLGMQQCRITLESVLEACEFGRLSMLKKLLQQPGIKQQLEAFSDSHTQSAQYSPLYRACKNGHEAIVEYLLAMPVTGVNLQSGSTGETALHAAVAGKSKGIKVAELLISAGANLEMTNRVAPGWQLRTPLQSAIDCGNVDGVRLLLDTGADPEANASTIGHSYSQPLVSAIQKGGEVAFLMSEMLLQHGALASGRAPLLACPLSSALHRGLDKCVELLLHHGADIETASYADFESGLERVFRNCSIETCQLFLDCGAIRGGMRCIQLTIRQTAALSGDAKKLEWVLEDPQFQDLVTTKGVKEVDVTPSHLLHHAGSREVVYLLIKRGADPNAIRARDLTTLQVVMKNKHLERDKLIEVCIALAENGAQFSTEKENPSALLATAMVSHNRSLMVPVLIQTGLKVDQNDKTKALLACICGYSAGGYSKNLVKPLVEWGADINGIDDKGRTLLLLVMQFRHYSSLEMLLSLGADYTVVDHDGNTVLHNIDTEKEGRGVEAASRLLKLGLSPNTPNKQGYTAFDIVLRSSSSNLKALYMQNGADPTCLRHYSSGENATPGRSGHPNAATLYANALKSLSLG